MVRCSSFISIPIIRNRPEIVSMCQALCKLDIRHWTFREFGNLRWLCSVLGYTIHKFKLISVFFCASLCFAGKIIGLNGGMRVGCGGRREERKSAQRPRKCMEHFKPLKRIIVCDIKNHSGSLCVLGKMVCNALCAIPLLCKCLTIHQCNIKVIDFIRHSIVLHAQFSSVQINMFAVKCWRLINLHQLLGFRFCSAFGHNNSKWRRARTHIQTKPMHRLNALLPNLLHNNILFAIGLQLGNKYRLFHLNVWLIDRPNKWNHFRICCTATGLYEKLQRTHKKSEQI